MGIICGRFEPSTSPDVLQKGGGGQLSLENFGAVSLLPPFVLFVSSNLVSS